MNCRITNVRYVALGVPNLAEQVEFYRDTWGLIERESGEDVAFMGTVSSTDPYVLRLRKTESERVDLVSFAVPTAADVDAYAADFRRRGIEIISGPGLVDLPGGGYGLRIFDPEGRTLEIAAEVEPVAARALLEREWMPGKLSHVVLNTPDLEGMIAWYCDVLGMRLSDRLADLMGFLAVDSHWHHALALARGAYPSINHVAYESRGIDEYMRASGRLMRAGENCVWGPGRHGPGDNTFSYFQDRGGFVVEYTTALQYIEDWTTWVPTVHPTIPEWSDQWGTACPRQAEPFLGPRDSGLFVAPPF